WSVKDYDFSILNKSLTAYLVTADLSALGFPIGSSATLTSVMVKNPARDKELPNLLSQRGWTSKTDLHLADQVTLKNASLKLTYGRENKDSITATFDDLTLSDFELAAATADSAGGPLSFVKSSRLGRLSFENFNINIKDNKSVITLNINNFINSNIKFGTNITHSDNLLDLLSSLVCDNSFITDLNYNYKNSDGQLQFSFSEQRINKLQTFSFNFYQIKDFYIKSNFIYGHDLFTYSNSDLTINNLDMLPLVNRVVSANLDPRNSNHRNYLYNFNEFAERYFTVLDLIIPKTEIIFTNKACCAKRHCAIINFIYLIKYINIDNHFCI
ncbi:MAG: hypothetical protein LBG48_04110, partial [Rickettsiales bacterium]|nr:hypothetical protein [Rickettsiales bacterium]